MKRRHRHRHEYPSEERLLRVVEASGLEPGQEEAGLAFARELMLAERRSARRDNSEVRNQKPECRMGGYTPEPVKRVVMKWLRRGLSGRTLWRIGEALIGRLFPAGR